MNAGFAKQGNLEMILSKFLKSRNFTKQSAIYFNEEYIWVITESGDMVYMPDFDGERFRLDLQCSDEDLGVCVLSALQKSRKIRFELSRSLIENCKSWDAEQVKILGYKSLRRMYKNMIRVSVQLRNNHLYFTPRRHVKLQAWEGFSDEFVGHEPEVISKFQPPAMIGAAARQAFLRCA
ncbi:contact-dependent growth inhibition system immunity protein [Erythrobacter sp. W302b]|uniref:contact-dependent growth inhibition system immunity protein n=1 Tax=Erythrobacter sp. W302b TaxID=3389874 RepID=UPI00396B4327